jgi:hypothetical protein
MWQQNVCWPKDFRAKAIEPSFSVGDLQIQMKRKKKARIKLIKKFMTSLQL